MSGINYDLTKIRGIALDVDGVLSPSTIPMGTDGQPVRMVNIKDGYALQLAVKRGLILSIITGGNTPGVQQRYSKLGIKDIYQGVATKINVFQDWMSANSLKPEEVIYMGDDIPDYEIMRRCGCPVCPADACPDIKDISIYISDRNGGHGCGRDVIEQVLRAQGKWLNGREAFGW